MSGLLLIVRIGGERVAVDATDVESVVELEALTPVPRAAGHVVGLAALRSRVLTVVDAPAALGGEAAAGAHREAMVVVSEGHPYALLVDGVEDVVEAAGEVEPVRSALAPGWRRVARGLVPAGEDLLVLVDVDSLIATPGAA